MVRAVRREGIGRPDVDARRRGRRRIAGRVRPCGRSRREKAGVGSSGERHAGVDPPALPWAGLASKAPRPVVVTGRVPRGGRWRCRSRPRRRGSPGSPARLRYRVDGDVPVLERARPSGRPGSANGGDRDHRGGPLLLGVGMQYQISYRDSSLRTWAFPRIPWGRVVPPDRSHRSSRLPGLPGLRRRPRLAPGEAIQDRGWLMGEGSSRIADVEWDGDPGGFGGPPTRSPCHDASQVKNPSAATYPG